ncbi:hypothetical protein PPGU19_092810 (plasmid) [Paraburkholderia sp. PGU19]|nr:hypothetical protein PPGU19_092810 [Paraburkholderia sp. PGU19]
MRRTGFIVGAHVERLEHPFQIEIKGHHMARHKCELPVARQVAECEKAEERVRKAPFQAPRSKARVSPA